MACLWILVQNSSDNTVTGSNFEITFVSKKHVVEDDVLFTNYLAENRGFRQRLWGAAIMRGEDMVQAGCDKLKPVLTSCCT